MNDLTLIIPAKNESESLPIVLKELEKYNLKILVSLKDDDTKTINSIKKTNAKIYFQSGNGYGNSIWEAINHCDTTFFCIFNADGSFDPGDLKKMYNKNQLLDFVYTSRYISPGGSEDDTIITYIGNKIFSLMGNILFSLKISDILYTYVMGKTKSFKKLGVSSNDFRLCVEMPIKMQLLNLKYDCLPSYERKRIAGKKKVNAFRDGFYIGIEMLKLFFNHTLFRKKVRR